MNFPESLDSRRQSLLGTDFRRDLGQRLEIEFGGFLLCLALDFISFPTALQLHCLREHLLSNQFIVGSMSVFVRAPISTRDLLHAFIRDDLGRHLACNFGFRQDFFLFSCCNRCNLSLKFQGTIFSIKAELKFMSNCRRIRNYRGTRVCFLIKSLTSSERD